MNVASPVLRTEEPVMQIQLWLKKTEVENDPLALPDPAGPCRTLLVGHLMVSSSKVFAYQSCLLTYRFWPVNNCVVHLSQPSCAFYPSHLPHLCCHAAFTIFILFMNHLV